MKKIAAIRLRGKFNVKDELKDTLTLIGLDRKNTCVVFKKATDTDLGMLKKAKDFITYGEISDETLKKLIEKRKLEKDTEKKTILRLPNPVKGFKSIKKGYKQGGDLGYRGEKINKLFERILQNLENK